MGVLGASLRSVGIELVAITLLLTGYLAYVLILMVRGMQLLEGSRVTELPGLIYVLFSTLALCLMLIRRYAELWKVFHHAPRVDGST